MAKLSAIIAGLSVGGIFGVAVLLSLTPATADAGYGITSSAPAVVSNEAQKSDMVVAEHRRAVPRALEVAEIRRTRTGFELIDAKGRVVYRSNEAARRTTVTKDVEVPLITGYGVAVGRADPHIENVED